ncbi:cytochrome c biogenesis protein CcdA, partial [Tessaracoccus lubricantis]
AGACTGPLLGAVLTVAAVGGNAVRGGLLLALFGAGMVVPLVVLSLLWNRLRLGERLRPRPLAVGPFTTSVVGLVSGLLFVGVGVLFVTTDATTGIGGILDATQQFRLESWLREVGLGVPDLAVVLVVVALGALLLWRWLRRPDA